MQQDQGYAYGLSYLDQINGLQAQLGKMAKKQEVPKPLGTLLWQWCLHCCMPRRVAQQEAPNLGAYLDAGRFTWEGCLKRRLLQLIHPIRRCQPWRIFLRWLVHPVWRHLNHNEPSSLFATNKWQRLLCWFMHIKLLQPLPTPSLSLVVASIKEEELFRRLGSFLLRLVSGLEKRRFQLVSVQLLAACTHQGTYVNVSLKHALKLSYLSHPFDSLAQIFWDRNCVWAHFCFMLKI